MGYVSTIQVLAGQVDPPTSELVGVLDSDASSCIIRSACPDIEPAWLAFRLTGRFQEGVTVDHLSQQQLGGDDRIHQIGFSWIEKDAIEAVRDRHRGVGSIDQAGTLAAIRDI